MENNNNTSVTTPTQALATTQPTSHTPVTELKAVVVGEENGSALGPATDQPMAAQSLAPHMYDPLLSLQKTQLIAKNDPEYIPTTDAALVATTFATEYFVKVLASEALRLSDYRSNGASPDTIQLAYDDVADAVSLDKSYGFLHETIPRTKNLRELVRENKVRYTMPDVQQQQQLQQQQAQLQQQQEQEQHALQTAQAAQEAQAVQAAHAAQAAQAAQVVQAAQTAQAAQYEQHAQPAQTHTIQVQLGATLAPQTSEVITLDSSDGEQH